MNEVLTRVPERSITRAFAVAVVTAGAVTSVELVVPPEPSVPVTSIGVVLSTPVYRLIDPTARADDPNVHL